MRVLWGNGPGGPGRRDRKWAFAAGALAVIAAFFLQYAWENDMSALRQGEGDKKEETVVSRAVTPSGPSGDSEEKEGQDRERAGASENGGEEQTTDETAAAESGESPEIGPDSSAASEGAGEAEEESESASKEEEAGNREGSGEEAGSGSGRKERQDGSGDGAEGSRDDSGNSLEESPGGSGSGSGESRDSSGSGRKEQREPGGKAADEPKPAPETEEAKPAQYAVSDYGPGDLVGEDAVYILGSSSFFQETEISDSLFQRIYGKSYKEDCIIPREDLRYIRVLYYDFNGNRRYGELVSNKAISRDLVEIFQELYNQKYRIEKIRLVDDYDADDDWSSSENNTSCFNYRTVAGKSTLSLHARGLAIDINPRYNPNVF